MTYRLLTYNIRKGARGREALVAEVLRACRPDLVVLQEARTPAAVERIAAGAGMPYWGAQRGQSLGFLSARPVRHAEWHQPRGSRHAFLEIEPADAGPRVFGVHLSAVHAAWTETRRVRELRALLASVARHQHGFHVLTGDFNTLAPGELLDIRKLPHRLKALVWLSGGRIRWRTIQVILDGGYADGYRLHHPDHAGHTFPTWDPHVRLDYVFVPARDARRLVECRIVTGEPAARASDHFPLFAELSCIPP
jgi:endonuclease/exonuclease/phosphatase family metal-dependent hydrolase